MTFRELTEKRYSVRNFSDRQIEEDKLNQVLEAVRIAPTAKNSQSEHVYVLRSPEAIAKVDKLTRCRYNAPVVLLFAYRRNEAFTYPDSTRQSGEEDCSIAAVYAMFEAAEQGLGTCWVNLFNPEQAKQIFKLPDEEEAVLLMPIGYASENAEPSPNHKKKKSLSDIVTYL